MDFRCERHTLANGLRVNLAPDPRVPVVAVNLWYEVGSRNEPSGLTGFAHLFEHMMFQGSANVPKNRHFELVEKAGGSLNATTWFDRTSYFDTVPSHHLELALWLESDRMGWMLPAMTQEKLDNQRDVVKNEKRQRYDNQPYGDWDERIQKLVYPDTHPYQHTVIGSMDDIDAASLEDITQFFQTYYSPNNAVLTVCGDFDSAEALGMIERQLGGIERGVDTPPLPGEPDIDQQIGATAWEEVEGDVPLPRVYVASRIPTFTDPRFHTAEVAGEIIASGRASRLYRSLVREQKVAKDVGGYVFPLDTGASMAVVWATGYADGDPETLQRSLLDTIDGMEDVRQEDVDRAVARAETSFVQEVEEVEERADLMSMFTQYFDDPLRVLGEVERLRAVTPDDVSSYARTVLGQENRAVLTYLPRDRSAGDGDGNGGVS
jgi:zinc protease